MTEFRPTQDQPFRPTAPSAETVFSRTYSRRKEDGTRENFEEAMLRTVNDIAEIGKYTQEEYALVRKQALAQHAFPSGRAFWVAGTDWSKKPENFYGYYNCSNLHIEDLQALGILVDLAMQGTGTGATLEEDVVAKLPPVTRTLHLKSVGPVGKTAGLSKTKCIWDDNTIHIRVGDSRKGWRDAYMALLYQATSSLRTTDCHVYVDLSQVRPSGEKLKGFGGTANPVKLPSMFGKVIDVLNGAVGRQLTPVEVCLLIDEAATCIVAGNIRRSAGMRQFSETDKEAATAKLGLYSQDEEGNWRVDPKKEALRMANHTRTYHHKPSYQEVEDAVRLQFQSGEGAIQYVPEAVARANADILNTAARKTTFLHAYAENGGRRSYAENVLRAYAVNDGLELTDKEFSHRMDRYGFNPCAEIISRDFMCNLAEVHLNTIDPNDYKAQEAAFYAAGLQVAALLQHRFTHERLQYSREIDPIVGVSFTGLFDFMVHTGGYDWLKWMMDGRKKGRAQRMYEAVERDYFLRWRRAANEGVKDYCEKHGLRVPNRVTTVQPAGCLEAEAVRVFDQGLLCADEIVEAGSGETTDLALSVRGGVGATTAIANDLLKLVKVTFKNGRTLRMTPDHRLSVDGSWKRADEMELGDIVDHSFGQYESTEDVKLRSLDADSYSSNEYRSQASGHSRGATPRVISQPTDVNPALAWFIGALYGNGCMSASKSRVRFVHGDEAILQHFAQVGRDLFGIEPTFHQSEGKKVKEVCFTSVMLTHWLKVNDLDKSEKSCDLSRIPATVRKSSRESILAFFAGLLDTDGCARKGSFSIDMASEGFLRHLQQVGEAVGLCFGLSHNTKGSNYQGEKSIWSLHLSRMKSSFSSVERLNELSLKLEERPVEEASRQFSYEPYAVEGIEFEETPDYSFDFAVEGVDDDDSWYWQGALKSHNTKSLLTGASSGWHAPISQRFIRRITLGVADPLVPTLLEKGYSVVPAQSARDDNGNLLDDISDPRVQEVLVEIPTEVSWANKPGCDQFDLSKLPIESQFGLYMNVQQFYCEHNTSATLELQEHEIEPLAQLIYDNIQNNKGYISAALLQRFDVGGGTFPRLPIQPITKEEYDNLIAIQEIAASDESFNDILNKYDNEEYSLESVTACTSSACLAKADADEREKNV